MAFPFASDGRNPRGAGKGLQGTAPRAADKPFGLEHFQVKWTRFTVENAA